MSTLSFSSDHGRRVLTKKSSVAKRLGSGGFCDGADMVADGKLVVVVMLVPSEALRLRWRRWPGVAEAEAEVDGPSVSGTLQRAAAVAAPTPAATEWVDEVRGGIAAGDCRKAEVEDEVVVDDDAWVAMTGWSFFDGRRKCSMWAVEGSGRLVSQSGTWIWSYGRCGGAAVGSRVGN